MSQSGPRPKPAYLINCRACPWWTLYMGGESRADRTAAAHGRVHGPTVDAVVAVARVPEGVEVGRGR